jgi:hypothetical protein
VLAMALALLAGLPASASAAVTGLGRASAATAFDSSSVKTATATCPAGKQVLGAAGGIDEGGPGSGEVVIEDLTPNAGLTSVSVRAIEAQSGFPGNWQVAAVAICATPPPGLERIVATSPSDSLNKSVTASCPIGKLVLGTGGDRTGGGGNVAMEDIRPNSALTSVTVVGLESEAATEEKWSLRAYAICANPVAGRQRVAATSPLNSSEPKIATASCANGKQVTGAGGEIGGGAGEVVMGGLNPNAGLSSVSVTAVEGGDGTSSSWSVRAYAICAAAAERAVAQSGNDSVEAKFVEGLCPSGKQPTGGGGEITGGGGQALINRILPLGPPPVSFFMPEVSVHGLEDQTGLSSNWILRSYAICASPPPGLVVVQARSSFDSENKSATMPCPSGKRVLGAAGHVSDGQVGLVLSAMAPNAALTSVTATGEEAENGISVDWEVQAVAVCASPPPGLELVSTTTDPDSDFSASLPATCPSGKNLVGTGGEIVGGLGQVVLDDLRPNAALTNVTITGFEDENGLASDWSLRAYAICASP